MLKDKLAPSRAVGHIAAFVVMTIWGTTFVSTKLLLINGLSASQIMVFRFFLAYLLMLPFVKKFKSESIKDEGVLMLAGVFGGSLYFFTENLALEYTLVTNVSLIICLAPILTLLITRITFRGERIAWYVVAGSLIALMGVSMVVFNGSYMLKLNLIGDFLTFIAALSWGIYSVLLKLLLRRYSALFITRKVFFYGVLTLLPVALWQGVDIDTEVLLRPVVFLNMLFLSVLASLLCFLVWTRTVRLLGVSMASNYIYIQPIAALITSHLVLDEQITAMAMVGGFFVLLGLMFAQRGERIRCWLGRYIGDWHLKS